VNSNLFSIKHSIYRMFSEQQIIMLHLLFYVTKGID